MIIVSNTTPLISLSKIDRLILLQELFENVFIPDAVYKEVVVQGQGRAGWNLPEYIKTKCVKNKMASNFLQAQLDDGESEAIVLAKELNADFLIIDEKKARRVAQLNNIPVIGTIGVLQKAKIQGNIKSIKVCLDKMIESVKMK